MAIAAREEQSSVPAESAERTADQSTVPGDVKAPSPVESAERGPDQSTVPGEVEVRALADSAQRAPDAGPVAEGTHAEGGNIVSEA